MKRSIHAMLKFECPAAIVKLLFSFPLDSAQFATISSGYAGAALGICHLCVCWVYPPGLVGERNLRTSLTLICWCRVCFLHLCDCSLSLAPSCLSLISFCE